MKTVGMITIYRKNYGAFLQAYALQQTLIKLGVQPELIRYDYYKDNTIFGLSRASNPSLKQIFKAFIVESVRFYPHRKKTQVFQRSITDKLFESKEYYKTYEALKSNPPCYDIYLTGSDQVFNPELSPQASPARFLDFAKKGIKASYAASAGTAGIKESHKNRIEESLKSFDHISVREEKLAEYIRDNFHLAVSQHIDPVFLLNIDEWSSFAKKVEGLPDKYIFYYRVLPQEELKVEAEKVSEETKLPVFVADGHDKFKNQLKRKHILSPEEWVYALIHAEYVVTNSFHGTAFSVNLKKNATVLIPPKGGERVTNLMEKCSISMKNSKYILSVNSNMFSKSDSYFDSERSRTKDYFSSLIQ